MTGLLSTGFVPKRLDQIKTELEAAFRTAFGPNVQLDPRSVYGQLVGIFAEREADIWELCEDVYSAGHLNGAVGVALDDQCALNALQRPGATFSEVTLRLTGTNGTLVLAGSRAADPVLNIEWITVANATIGPTGVDAIARPASTGPIRGLAGTITQIRTVIAGWTGVTNVLDAAVGRDQYNEAQLRALNRLTMKSGGGSSVDGLRALLLRLTGVTECEIIENVTELPDADGRPAHSFESVVRGGADQAIADLIWDAGTGGIRTHGTIVSTVVDDAGDNQTVRWSRPVDVNIWVTVQIERGEGWPTNGAALVLQEILTYGSSFALGQDVFAFQVAQRIETRGIKSATIRVGTAASPTGDRVTISRVQLARFDSSRIAVTEV